MKKFKSHLAYVYDIWKYVDAEGKIVEIPRPNSPNEWIEYDMAGNIIGHSKGAIPLIKFRQMIKDGVYKKKNVGKSVDFFFAAPYEVLQYKPYILIRGIFDDYIESLKEIFNNSPDWLRVNYNMEHDYHYEEETRKNFWTHHCNAVFVTIDFYEENVEKARELLPQFEFDLNSFKRHIGNRYDNLEA